MEWRINKQDKDRVAELGKSLEVSPVIAWVLMNRGITDAEAGGDFLNLLLSQLKPEKWMAGMDRAVKL